MKSSPSREFGMTAYIITTQDTWHALEYTQKLTCGRTIFSAHKQEFPDEAQMVSTMREALDIAVNSPGKIVITESQVAPDSWRYNVFYGRISDAHNGPSPA